MLCCSLILAVQYARRQCHPCTDSNTPPKGGLFCKPATRMTYAQCLVYPPLDQTPYHMLSHSLSNPPTHLVMQLQHALYIDDSWLKQVQACGACIGATPGCWIMQAEASHLQHLAHQAEPVAVYTTGGQAQHHITCLDITTCRGKEGEKGGGRACTEKLVTIVRKLACMMGMKEDGGLRPAGTASSGFAWPTCWLQRRGSKQGKVGIGSARRQLSTAGTAPTHQEQAITRRSPYYSLYKLLNPQHAHAARGNLNWGQTKQAAKQGSYPRPFPRCQPVDSSLAHL